MSGSAIVYITELYSKERVVSCYLQSSFSSMPTRDAGTYDTQFSAPSFRLAFAPNCHEKEDEEEEEGEIQRRVVG